MNHGRQGPKFWKHFLEGELLDKGSLHDGAGA